MQIESQSPDLLVLARPASSWAVPAAIALTAFGILFSWFVYFGFIFNTIQVLVFIGLAFSVLDERERIEVNKLQRTIRLHRKFLGYMVETITIPISDIDVIEQEENKSGSGMRRYRLSVQLGNGMVVPMTTNYVYSSVKPYVDLLCEFLEMPPIQEGENPWVEEDSTYEESSKDK